MSTTTLRRGLNGQSHEWTTSADMGRLPKFTANDIAAIQKITELHDEAFEHYQLRSDASWKSSEGSVSIEFGNYWSRLEGIPFTVGVYSYALGLGPSRMNYFQNVHQALAEVTRWHRAEMDDPID